MQTPTMKNEDAYPPDWCIFYRAMMGQYNGKGWDDNKTCLAGVRYEEVRILTDRYHYPCFRSDAVDPALAGKFNCDRIQYPSKEQAERYEALVRKHIETFTQELKSDICPHCHQPIKRYEQVGRCVYAHPCNHRLYQGKAPKAKAV